MKRVLVIDGGGVKGVMPLNVLNHIEAVIERPIHEIFDLVIGTSVGSIIGGVLSSTDVTAGDLLDRMMIAIPVIFKWRLRVPFIQPKYSRRVLNELLDDCIGTDTPMKKCRTKFMCTGVNIVDSRTHFFKSWEEADGELKLVKAITRSYAAPLYFGSVDDPKDKSVWLDGGTGSMSSPTLHALTEILRQGWLKDDNVHVLSLGCGQSFHGTSYEKAKCYRNIRQVYFYADPIEGGLARVQNPKDHNEAMSSIAALTGKLSFQRVEYYNLSKKMDKIDAAKYIHCYKRIGEDLAKDVDYDKLKG